MHDSLFNIYSIKNVVQKMSLKNELQNTKMTNENTVATYFVRISQIIYQIQAIGESIPDKKVVITTLNGFPIS